MNTVSYLISVIIPSYKPKGYLWSCLKSIQSQSLDKSQYEVIIVLNGCREPYYSLIKSFLESSEVSFNFTLIQLDAGGVSNARNKGIDSAKGEYIAFIDDDDYVSDSYLEELLKVSSYDTIGLSKTLAFYDGHEETFSYRLTKEYDNNHQRGKQPFFIPRRLFAGPCMKLIHRDIIGTRRFDVRFRNSEDSLFMFAISDRIRFASFTGETAVYYRRYREGSAVMAKRTSLEKAKNALQIIKEESRLYFIAFPKYKFVFYLTRVLGAVRGTIK